ncbi:MAG: uroporphyrinogen decarboxylase family protein [Armatimonadota bacterium]
MNPMTKRERMRAFVRGEAHDRIPFAQYDNMIPNKEMWDVLGHDNVGLIRWTRPYRIEYPNCRQEIEPVVHDGFVGERRILHTPAGSLESLYQSEPAYGSFAARERYVKEPADYDILDAYLADAQVIYDLTLLEKDLRELGEDGIPMSPVPRTPWQQLWVEWVEIGDLAWHMAEDEDRVMRTVGLMERILRQAFDCAGRADLVYVDIPDNLTAPMISPANFRRFCLPLYLELADRLAEKGTPMFCHADGDLKPLWELIGESGLNGLDSFSPAPDNDTSVGDAVAAWPRMRLACNYPSSVHLRTPEEIREITREMLAQGGHTGRLQIQLSENIPMHRWRTTLPIIMEEILAYGTPECYR